jgi:hypothetical protein
MVPMVARQIDEYVDLIGVDLPRQFFVVQCRAVPPVVGYVWNRSVRASSRGLE